MDADYQQRLIESMNRVLTLDWMEQNKPSRYAPPDDPVFEYESQISDRPIKPFNDTVSVIAWVDQEEQIVVRVGREPDGCWTWVQLDRSKVLASCGHANDHNLGAQTCFEAMMSAEATIAMREHNQITRGLIEAIGQNRRRAVLRKLGLFTN